MWHAAPPGVTAITLERGVTHDVTFEESAPHREGD
jgi:hypothetical protein